VAPKPSHRMCGKSIWCARRHARVRLGGRPRLARLMSRTLPVVISGLLVLAGIAASLYALNATVDAGVGTGIGALLFIVVAAAVILE
jgi:hypothetical protein